MVGNYNKEFWDALGINPNDPVGVIKTVFYNQDAFKKNPLKDNPMYLVRRGGMNYACIDFVKGKNNRWILKFSAYPVDQVYLDLAKEYDAEDEYPYFYLEVRYNGKLDYMTANMVYVNYKRTINGEKVEFQHRLSTEEKTYVLGVIETLKDVPDYMQRLIGIRE